MTDDPRDAAQLNFDSVRPGVWRCTCTYVICADATYGLACSCPAGRHGKRCHHVAELVRRQQEQPS